MCENGYRSGRKSIMSLIVFSLRPRNLTADATELLLCREGRTKPKIFSLPDTYLDRYYGIRYYHEIDSPNVKYVRPLTSEWANVPWANFSLAQISFKKKVFD